MQFDINFQLICLSAYLVVLNDNFVCCVQFLNIQYNPFFIYSFPSIASFEFGKIIWLRKYCTLFYTHLTYLVSLKAFGISTLIYGGIACRGDAIY